MWFILRCCQYLDYVSSNESMYDGLERVWKQAIVALFLFWNFLGRLKKTTKNWQNSRFPRRVSNWEPRGYKSRASPLHHLVWLSKAYVLVRQNYYVRCMGKDVSNKLFWLRTFKTKFHQNTSNSFRNERSGRTDVYTVSLVICQFMKTKQQKKARNKTPFAHINLRRLY